MSRYIKLAGIQTTDPNAPRALTTYAEDAFTRSDGPLTTTPDGQNYLLHYGTYLSIIGNQVGGVGITNPSGPQANGAKALLETGTPDVEISLVYASGYNRVGPMFRALPNWSGYRISGNGANQTEFHKVGADGAGTTVLQTWPGFGISAGMVVKVICSGDTMSVYRNGVLLGSVTDSSYKGTRHGLYLSADTNRVDDLKITSLR